MTPKYIALLLLIVALAIGATTVWFSDRWTPAESYQSGSFIGVGFLWLIVIVLAAAAFVIFAVLGWEALGP